MRMTRSSVAYTGRVSARWWSRLLKPLPVFGVLMFLAVAAGFAEETRRNALVANGVAVGQIVTPGEPSDAETFAAEELQNYVRKISGATLRIVATDKAGQTPAIIVGRHPAARHVAQQLKLRCPGKYDAIAVVGQGGRLFLVGHCETATVWAAWDWLESLGVRWLMPGELGEYAPTLEDIDITPGAKYDAPRLTFRGPCGGEALQLDPEDAPQAAKRSVAHSLFMLRMRTNNTFGSLLDPRIKRNKKFAWVLKDRFATVGEGHSYKLLLPPSRYYNDHPEWFNMLGGKRQRSGAWQVCFTNREAASQFADNIIARARLYIERFGIPVERMIMAVSPNDCMARCECEKCRTLLDSGNSATSLVTLFANRVAAKVRKTFPQARIVFYAYYNHAFPPERVKPGPGVCPRIAFWVWSGSFGANHAKPMFSEANDRYRRAFRTWAKISDGVSARTYYGHYHWFTPWPKVTQMAHDIKTMAAEPKFYGMWSESYFHWGTQGLNFYLHPKLMWNPELDVEKTMDDYCEKAFGPAASAMRRYFDALQAQMDRLDYVCGYTVEISKLLTPRVIQECNKLIDEAERHLPNMDAGTRWRTNLVAQAWRASAKFGEAVHLFVSPSPRPADRLRILRLCDEVDAFARTNLGGWAFDYRRVAKGSIDRIARPLRLDLNSLPRGEHVWGEGLHRGGGIKFYAKWAGFQCGMWGYTLPPGGKGVFELPLRAAAGARIAAAEARWSFDPGDFFDARLTVVSEGGKEHVLAPTLRSVRGAVVAPGAALGKKGIVFRLTATNPDLKRRVYLTGVRLKIIVR